MIYTNCNKVLEKGKSKEKPHEKNVIIYMSDSINGLHWVLAIAHCEPIVWQSLKQIIAVSSVYPIVQLPMTTKQPLLNYVYTVGSLWLCSHYIIVLICTGPKSIYLRG